MKAAFLSGKDLAVHSIQWMLNDEFGSENVTAIPVETLDSTDLSRHDLLVLPGCVDEISPYPDFMSPRAVNNLRTAVENGMVLWSDCSGTYELLRNIHYLNSAGETRTRQGLGFIDGDARGPVEGPAIAPSVEDRFADVVIKRIFYTSAQAGKHTVDVCYGNGPGIHLSSQERTNPDVRPMARYHDTDESPVAALSKKFGRGLILSFGVLIQIAPAHLQGDPADKNMARHRRAMRDHLTRLDIPRQTMLRDVFAMARDHVRQQKSLSTSLPAEEPGYCRYA